MFHSSNASSYSNHQMLTYSSLRTWMEPWGNHPRWSNNNEYTILIWILLRPAMSRKLAVTEEIENILSLTVQLNALHNRQALFGWHEKQKGKQAGFLFGFRLAREHTGEMSVDPTGCELDTWTKLNKERKLNTRVEIGRSSNPSPYIESKINLWS